MIEPTTTTFAAPIDDVRARNKEILFAALADAGIYRVLVNYDGAGDSGQIEDVEASDDRNQRIPLPTEPTVQLVSQNPEYPHDPLNLEAAIESLAWDYLDLDSLFGWENNDGAFGSFVFDVPAGTVTLEHNQRYTEVNTTSHEF
jgi:hypothetical protein